MQLSGIKTLHRTGGVVLTTTQAKMLHECTGKIPCTACDKAEVAAAPIPHQSLRPPSEIDPGVVSVDLKGPMSPTPTGANYIAAVRQGTAGVAAAGFSVGKGEDAAEKVIAALQELKSKWGVKITTLVSDGGGEFQPQRLQVWLREQGIRHVSTSADSPRKNGMIERFWGIIFKRARAAMITAGSPRKFWAEAVSYTVDVYNMMPSASRNMLSPYEILLHRKPPLGRIQPWGCLGMTRIPRTQVTKGNMADRSRPLILFGFHGKDGYRMYNPSTARIVTSRSVSFHPDVYPFQSPHVPLEDQQHNIRSYQNDLHLDEPGEAVQPEDQQDVVPTPVELVPRPLPVRRSGRVTADPYRYDPSAHRTVDAGDEDKFLNPKNYKQAHHPDNPYADNWREADESEVAGLEASQAYKYETPRPGDLKLRSIMLRSTKMGSKGGIEVFKSRMVADGSKQPNSTKSFAPTPRFTTTRFVLKIIVDHGLAAEQMDVKQAFLLSKLPTDARIFIYPPPGFPRKVPQGKLLRLLKCLYGLKQSGREWNKNVHNFITALQGHNFVRSTADPCLYIDTTVFPISIILVFVDDFIAAGQQNRLDDIVNKFDRKYPIKRLGKLFWYLKCHILRSVRFGWLHFNQEMFAREILRIAGMADCKPVPTPAIDYLEMPEEIVGDQILDASMAITVGKITGMLLYLTVATRLDMAFAVGQVCRFSSKPCRAVWDYIKRVLRYLKGTVRFGIMYRRGNYGRARHATLQGYSDANFAGGKSTKARSISASVFMLGGSAVVHRSKLQSSVAATVCEAELVAINETAKEGLFLLKLMRDFDMEVAPTVLRADNQASITISEDFRVSERSKHISVKHFYIRELVDAGIFSFSFTATSNNVADLGTKPVTGEPFRKHRAAIGVVDCPDQGCPAD